MADELTTTGGFRLHRGMHLLVDEADYRYGVGRVHLIVREALEVVTAVDGEWVELAADEVMWNGVTCRRLIQVRVTALPRAVRPAPGAP